MTALQAFQRLARATGNLINEFLMTPVFRLTWKFTVVLARKFHKLRIKLAEFIAPSDTKILQMNVTQAWLNSRDNMAKAFSQLPGRIYRPGDPSQFEEIAVNMRDFKELYGSHPYQASSYEELVPSSFELSDHELVNKSTRNATRTAPKKETPMDDEMITIKYTINTGYVGCEVEGSIVVEADCTDEEIEEIIQDQVFNTVEWGWERAKDDD